jgi:ATP-binding cassette subfamily C (CFTR/MRP) protein 1
MPVMTIFLFASIVYGATFAITPTILKAWSESGGLHTWFYIGMYTLSGGLAFFTTAVVIW